MYIYRCNPQKKLSFGERKILPVANMERGCHSSGHGGGGGGDSSSAAAYLKHLNKISHKISKPIRKPPIYENHSVQSSQLAQQSEATAAAAAAMAPPPQQQPPVYNINKSDFRDLVQKLTGSPAHERMMMSTPPPPIHQPKPPSSRLQRIRPPPLAQISNRPSPLLNYAVPPPLLLPPGGPRPPVQTQPPLSPLPPFPAVHAAAESPISAYMRFLHTSFTAAVASPRWNTIAPSPPQQKQNPLFPPQQQQNPLFPPPQPQQNPQQFPQFPNMPSSPLPFSCLPSPRSPCALLSPNLLLSPAGQLGFPQLPLSPTSPTWKGI